MCGDGNTVARFFAVLKSRGILREVGLSKAVRLVCQILSLHDTEKNYGIRHTNFSSSSI